MTESVETPLQKLRDILLYLGNNCELLPISEQVHFESLLVALDANPEDLDEYRYVAQLYFVEDILNVPGSEPAEDALATLQFIVNLPLIFENASAEVQLKALQLIQACNQILPAGFLAMTQKGELFYKYSLKAESQEIPLPVIVDELNLIGFFLPLFMPIFEEALTGDTPTEALFESLERAVGTLFGKEQLQELELE